MKPEDQIPAAGTTQTPLTADQLIADGWKEYPDQFRKYARMFCKYFPTPTRCFLNDDKPGLQVCLYLSEWESRISVEMEVCSGLSDGTWIKIHNYSLPNTLPEVLALIPMILGIWEHAANGKSALAASRAREAELVKFAREVVKHCECPLVDCINVKRLGEMAKAALTAPPANSKEMNK